VRWSPLPLVRADVLRVTGLRSEATARQVDPRSEKAPARPFLSLLSSPTFNHAPAIRALDCLLAFGYKCVRSLESKRRFCITPATAQNSSAPKT